MEECRVNVDHATLKRWVVNYSPLITAEDKKRKRAGASSWRVDETYMKVKGHWVYWYRAVDKHGDTLDFMLSEQSDEAAATAFSSNRRSTTTACPAHHGQKRGKLCGH